MIRAAFFDIDGTLLSPRTGRVPPSTRRAVDALRAQGVRVVVATGRHPLELDLAGLEGMTFDGYAAANGQICLDGERRLFAGYPLSAEGTDALVRLFEERKQLLWLFGEATCYANRADDELLALSAATTGLVPEVRPYDGMTIYQAVMLMEERDEVALTARLPGCRFQRWGARGVDIIAEDGGKVAGMKAFLERFGIAREECVAFGDQHNDIDMLRFAGIGVAMGNGTEAVRQAADYVTSSVDEDGIARALVELGVLSED